MRGLCSLLLVASLATGPWRRCRVVWNQTGRPVLIALIALGALVGCATPDVIRLPGPVEYRDRLVVQPIPAELLRAHPVAEGPLAVCPQVAAQRRSELEACNADKAALRRLSGDTP
jgi:hypothetical protein